MVASGDGEPPSPDDQGTGGWPPRAGVGVGLGGPTLTETLITDGRPSQPGGGRVAADPGRASRPETGSAVTVVAVPAEQPAGPGGDLGAPAIPRPPRPRLHGDLIQPGRNGQARIWSGGLP